MKKILIISIIGVFLMTGCDIIKEIQTFGDDVSKSYDKAAEETKETIKEVKDAKAKVEETFQDLNNAKNKVKEATDAVSEVVK